MLKCVKYLTANHFSPDRDQAIKRVMNHFWTEEDGISDERTELVEDAVDELINLGYAPNVIEGDLVANCTDSMLAFQHEQVGPHCSPMLRQEIINEFLPLDSRVKRWSMEDEYGSDNIAAGCSPEPIGPAGRVTVPYRENGEYGDIENDLWKTFGRIFESLKDVDWDSMTVDSADILISVEYVPSGAPPARD